MKKIIYSLPLTVLLVACGGGSDTTPSAEEPLVEAALPEVTTDSDTLEVTADFAFNTARTVTIAFDIDEARGKEASVSVCTEYTAVNAFDIDYESCAVRSAMSDGVFNHTMELTNAYDSVIGVVWFEDQTIQPIAKEFFIDDSLDTRSKDGSRTIVWN